MRASAASPFFSSTPCSEIVATPLTANFDSTGVLDRVSMPTRACWLAVLLTRRTTPSTQLLPPSGCSASSAHAQPVALQLRHHRAEAARADVLHDPAFGFLVIEVERIAAAQHAD